MGVFKDPFREAAFQRWVKALDAPAYAVPKLRAKVKKLKMTDDELDRDTKRILEESTTEGSCFPFDDPEKERAFLIWSDPYNLSGEVAVRLRKKVFELSAAPQELLIDCGDRFWLSQLVEEVESEIRNENRKAERKKKKGSQEMEKFECRKGCGACCIFMSIPTPIPGHPDGKPAGVTCKCLTSAWECSLYGMDFMPQVCQEFKGSAELCGKEFDEAKLNIISLEREASSKSKEKNMGAGVVKLTVTKKFEDMVDAYKTELEAYITKHGMKSVKVKPHYFYDSSQKTSPWTTAEDVLRTSKSGPTFGFYRFDKEFPEEHRGEYTFIIFCCDRGAAYAVAFLVTTLYEHWEVPVAQVIRDMHSLRKVLEQGLSTDQPFPELEQAKEKNVQFKKEDGYKEDLTPVEQTFLRELVKGKLTPLQHEALFEKASIPFGFVYSDLSSVGKATLWNILMDAEELNGEAVDQDIRIAIQNYGKLPQAEAAI